MQGPYNTNLLVAGWDEKTGPSLYWMDYLATMHSMNIAGTGYGKRHTCSVLRLSFPCQDNVAPEADNAWSVILKFCRAVSCLISAALCVLTAHGQSSLGGFCAKQTVGPYSGRIG